MIIKPIIYNTCFIRISCVTLRIKQLTMSKTTRKEVVLSPETIKALQKQADADNRSLKNYMEKVLTKQAKAKAAA